MSFNKEELKEILEQHKLWLTTSGGKRANLQDADLRGADLRGADLQGANLQGADLRCADLQDADLQGADLQDADLQGADLRCADLRCADLQDADLRGANLQGANLQGANLQGANLQGSNLQGANLQGADIDFSSMPLWCGDLKANYDDKQIIQQLYHVLSHVKNSNNCSEILKDIMLNDEMIALANEFHRVKECGEIVKESETE